MTGAPPRTTGFAGEHSELSWVDEILTRATARSPDKPCILVPEGPTLTYRELDRRASAFARVLRQQGCQPGDRLALANCNTPGFFAALFGALRAGLIAVPVDANLGPLELKNVLAHSQPRAVVVDRRTAAAFATLEVTRWALDADAGVPWHDLDASGLDAAPELPTRPDPQPEGAILLYTSGTTAAPKGALHGHAGVLSKLAAIQQWFGLDEHTTSLCLLPTHFGHGLVASCLATFHYGGTLVLCRPFDLQLLQRLFALVEQYQVNVLSSVPAIIRLLLRFAEATGQARTPAPSSLRFLTCASAPLHPDEVDAFEARFGVPLLNCYGITEGGTWSAMSPPSGERDRRSTGTAHGCRIRAVDSHRVELPPGEIGHLEISGPSLMLGYYLDPEATARTIVDGWLATGDLGHVDAQGRLFLAGRSKELIIRAGANIYPAEVEAVVMRHPGVAEAYVVGLDHPILGERVAACVVLRAGHTVSREELITHCRGHLAHYKCPEEIKFVDAVPKTSRGKVVRASIQAVFAQRGAPSAG
jgi:acyl-CoA synthetase (AMP-forming)/AMP-acid ligase II